MLDFRKFEQLKDLLEFKSHFRFKLVTFPRDFDALVSFKTLVEEASWSDLGDEISVLHIFEDQSSYLDWADEFTLINLSYISNVIVIGYDESDLKEFALTFENEKALEDFVESRKESFVNAMHLKLDDQMIDELADETRKSQIKFYDQKISKAKLDIKLATKALKEYEELKGSLLNESK